MHNKTIAIWDNCSYAPEAGDRKPTMRSYLLDYSPEMPIGRKRSVVFICPGIKAARSSFLIAYLS